MNATETVRKGQRWEPCGSSGCGWWSRRDAEGNEVEHRPLDDPLADTPEGDHEFMETMRWADARELGRVCLQRMLEYDYALLGGPDFKAAFLEALAAAIKGEQGNG